MIRQTLQDLPVGLVQTYERILLKISKSPLRKQEIALRVFGWTLCSRRPMKAEELQEAVAFENSDLSWDRDKIPDEDLMIETCRGLLVREEEDRTVRFAHHTVQQYLLSAPAIKTSEGPSFSIPPYSEAEAFVGQVCVTYLCFSDFETQIALRTPNVQLEALGVLKAGGPVGIPTVLGIGKSWLELPYRLLGGKSPTAPPSIDYSKYLMSDTRTRPQVSSGLMEKYRLLEYIVNYWMDHTRELTLAVDAKFRHLVMHKTLSFEFRPWGPNQHLGPYGCVKCSDLTQAAKKLPFMSLFHYAAQTGHWNLMESIVTEYCQHELPFDETLLIACRQGQDLIVHNLMRRVNFDISDGRAINVAAAAGHADVLKYLLEHSQITQDDKRFSSYNLDANASSVLNLAATNGHEEVLDIIFNFCEWGHQGDSKIWTPSIIVDGKEELTGCTPLFSAVMRGHENVVRNLLARGAKIKTHGTSAVHFAAEYGHQEILRLLLEITAKDLYNDGEDMTDELILDLLNYWNIGGETPLHKAASNGHTAVVGLILEYQVRLDTRTNESGVGVERIGYTALGLAARGGHLDTVKFLIDKGANIETKTLDVGWGVLHFAAAEGHVAVVQWLLEKGAPPRAEARGGVTAVQLAALRGHDGVVRALLDFDSREGRTNGLYADAIEIVTLIEIAAEHAWKVLLRTLLDDYVGVYGKGYAELALQMAKHKKYKRAVSVLTSLLKERSWD